jgi:peptide/nickel transport system permease protein
MAITDSAYAEPAALPVAPNRRGVFGRLFRKNAARFSIAIIGVAVLCALFPGLLAPKDPFAQELSTRLLPPVFMEGGIEGYLLGTDQLGRDILSRIIYGARTTLLVSMAAVLLSGLIGTGAGLAAGYFGGKTDGVIQRLIDMQLAFPLVLLVIAIVAVIGPSTGNLILVMGLSGWPRFARIVRGSTMQVRGLEYIEAARSIGAAQTRIMVHHVLPNILSAIIVYASFELARMVLLEATLSFLGLGIQPPTPTWGGMINDGRKYLGIGWSASLFPGMAIALIILAFNVLGDELRDALDPQLDEN